MRIAVCDDDWQEQEKFMEALHEWDPTRSPECFSDGETLLQAAKKSPPFSIAFLDIYMPKENGIDIAVELRKISPETGIVFVTTSEEYAVDAFALNALHYLVKPITADGIRDAFARLTKQKVRERPTILVTVRRGSRSIYLEEILSLQSADHRTGISLSDGELLSVWMPIGELEQQLDDRFLKIQRGLIVNMAYIDRMESDGCILRNGIRVLFSRKSRAAIRSAYDDYAFAHLSRRRSLRGGKR